MIKELESTLLLSSKKAVVIGSGRSGMAAVRLLVREGAKVCLMESNPKHIQEAFSKEAESMGVEILCASLKESAEKVFSDVDYIIPSPGVPLASILRFLPENNSPKILGELELAWHFVKNETILAITGSSGKTTTVSLIAAMLEADGKNVFLGGNIGTPLSEYILARDEQNKEADMLVLEVSSFQLQTCETFKPHVAMLLNITENHLDYHADMQEYIDAKMSIFRNQNNNDFAIIYSPLKELATKYNIKASCEFFEKDLDRFPERLLLGNHNAVNIEAAWLACSAVGVDLNNARKAVTNFKPLEHRLERVQELDGVLYVNDSKCTTVDAMRAALQSFSDSNNDIILLCGGKFKGGDLASLLPLIRKHVKSIQLFGASREYFEQAWANSLEKTDIKINWSANLKEALQNAKAQATSGNIILMSPATSSYDLYNNYMERGEDFKSIVKDLIGN